MMIDGIDVSRYQTTTPSMAGRGFLFARATYGAVHDPMFATHIANARKAGALVGAYHFGVGDVSIPDQVSAFLAAAGKVDFYALDLERNGAHVSMTGAQASAFISAVKAKGHRIGLYHSESGFPSLGQSYNWVANWSQIPAIGWTFWQYRGSPLDLDRFNGDLAKLRVLAGQAPAPQPTRFRVVMTGYTPLFVAPNGKRLPALYHASVLATRRLVGTQWWYRIASRADGTKARTAGQWFKSNGHTEVSRA